MIGISVEATDSMQVERRLRRVKPKKRVGFDRQNYFLKTFYLEDIIAIYSTLETAKVGREKPRGLAFVSIVFPQAVSSVSLTASEPSVADVLELQPSLSSAGFDGAVWNVSEINPPDAGCWTHPVVVETEDGSEVRAPFTFVAVE